MKTSLKNEALKKIPEIKKLTYRGRLLRVIVETIIELNKFPSQQDLKLISINSANFPEIQSFDTLGSHEEIISAVKDFCLQFHLHEIVPLCSLENIGISTTGVVYLYKGENYYKIGRSNNAERRDREIKLQLPFKVNLIHTIKTSNPAKIEKYWHNYFKSKRLNGEWFQLTNSDVALFKAKIFM